MQWKGKVPNHETGSTLDMQLSFLSKKLVISLLQCPLPILYILQMLVLSRVNLMPKY